MADSLLTKAQTWAREVLKPGKELGLASLVIARIEVLVPGVVRTVVERFEYACLDSKQDREALIKALVEALS